MGQTRLSELAKKAGVSITTVSRVLNHSGYVADDMRKRVEQAVKETGYVHPARKISSRREKIIGLISMSSVLNPYFERMTQSLREKADKHGYYCIQVSSLILDNQTLAMHAQRLASLGVCGIIICSFNEEYLDDTTRTILNHCDIPIVFLERSSGCYGFNRVLIDNELGTYSATRHLIDKGHRHLLYITLNKQTLVERSRTEGFVKAVEETPKGSINYQILPCTYSTPAAAMSAMQAAYEKDPEITGIVAWNDVYAAGALHYLNKIGRKVPDDVELIGYDNVLAPFLEPPLSSVEMPTYEIAAAAIEIIDKSQNQKTPPLPRTITLEPRLVIR